MAMIKDLIGFEKRYQIIDSGEIYSLITNKLLKHALDKDGYHYVVLVNNGKRYTRRIHRLNAETFLENPDNKLEVNHKDGDKNNNAVYNLEWVTKSENELHAYRTGLKKAYDMKGEGHPRHKLTNIEVAEIREIKNKTIQEIAKIYGVNNSTISRIRNNKIWT